MPDVTLAASRGRLPPNAAKVLVQPAILAWNGRAATRTVLVSAIVEVDQPVAGDQHDAAGDRTAFDRAKGEQVAGDRGPKRTGEVVPFNAPLEIEGEVELA